MLIRRIVADDENGRRVVDLAHARCQSRLAVERRRQGREVGCAMMIHIVGLQHHPCKLRKQIVFLVGSTRRTYDANRLPAFRVANLGKSSANQLKRLFPSSWSEFAVLANQRLGKTLGALREVERV